MAKPSKTLDKIDSLMEKASGSLAGGDYFACEEGCSRALELAHVARDWDRMARILMPLEEARRQKRLEASDTGVIRRIASVDELVGMEKVESGCWLLEPLIVAAHGREFRGLADSQKCPVLVIVREPLTQLGDWPLAVLGPVVVRTRVAPAEELTAEWFLAAAEALGEEAIESVETDLEPEVRVNRLMDRLLALRDHDELHQALAEACRGVIRSGATA